MKMTAQERSVRRFFTDVEKKTIMPDRATLLDYEFRRWVEEVRAASRLFSRMSESEDWAGMIRAMCGMQYVLLSASAAMGISLDHFFTDCIGIGDDSDIDGLLERLIASEKPSELAVEIVRKLGLCRTEDNAHIVDAVINASEPPF